MLIRVLFIVLATTGAAFSQSYGSWGIDTSRDDFTDNLNVVIGTASKEEMSCTRSDSRAEPIILVMGCGGNRTVVGMAFQHCPDFPPNSSNIPINIKYRVDKLPAKTQSFYAKGKTVGINPGGQSIFFIKQLIGHDKLIMRIAEGSETITFSLNGLDEKVAKLRKACNW